MQNPPGLSVCFILACWYLFSTLIPGYALGPQTQPVDLKPDKEQVFYVSCQSGENNQDGSKAKPWKTISSALGATQSADESRPAVILVAAGTYVEGSLALRPWVSLYGGYDPHTWQRDIHKFQSILDGKQSDRLIIGADHATLDGFVLQNGQSDGFGGCILCDQTSPTISNNLIRANKTIRPADFNTTHTIHQEGNGGGAICCLHASPWIHHNIIELNQTGVGNGGALLMLGYTSSVIEENVFFQNKTGLEDEQTRSSNGGAIACSHFASPTIRKNFILENHAGGRGDGGGIYCEYSSKPILSGNLLMRNSSDDDGAGLYTMQGSLTTLNSNLIVGNARSYRPGSTLRASKCGALSLSGNTIVGNYGTTAIIINSWLDSRNNLICQNVGSGIFGKLSEITCYNDTICDHTAEGASQESGAMYMTNCILSGNGSGGTNANAQVRIQADGLSLLNCLVRGGSVDYPGRNEKMPMTAELSGIFRGQGNLDADPGFIDDSIRIEGQMDCFKPDEQATHIVLKEKPEKDITSRPIRINQEWSVVKKLDGQDLLVWGDLGKAGGSGTAVSVYIPATYHLSSDSPCLNAGRSLGAPSNDIDLEERPIHRLSKEKPDIGADERIVN